MPFTKIVEGVIHVKGKFAEEFGFLTSYLFISEDEVIIIDPGTAGQPGREIEEAIKIHGLNPKSDVVGIICTHAHPDHIGGIERLRRTIPAPVMIHANDAEVIKNPQLFIKERLWLDRAGRLSMKVDRSPIRVNFHGIHPEKVLKHEDEITVGSDRLRVLHTGGHSAGHCVIYSSNKRVLFSGDEVNNYPTDARKFYVDLSGSLSEKALALQKISKLDIDYLLPAHDIAHLFNDVSVQFKEAYDGVLQFQDALLRIVSARGEADVLQISFDLQQSKSVPLPSGHPALLPTTIVAALQTLRNAGLVEEVDGLWKVS